MPRHQLNSGVDGSQRAVRRQKLTLECDRSQVQFLEELIRMCEEKQQELESTNPDMAGWFFSHACCMQERRDTLVMMLTTGNCR